MDWLIEGRLNLCFWAKKKMGDVCVCVGGNFYIRFSNDYFFDTVDKIYKYYLVINVLFSEKSRTIKYQV